jgi:tRNA threonylcarbamoyl adenosine modification protein YjeE
MLHEPAGAAGNDPAAVSNAILVREVAAAEATEALARSLAPLARRGDVVAIAGDLGAGKTVFARGFVRALSGDAEEVPSPTFTLLQSYDARDPTLGQVHHFDLYRLGSADEVIELGFEEALTSGVLLVEWPERLGRLLPAGCLQVRIVALSTGDDRRIEVTGDAAWRLRLAEAGFV